MAMIAHGHASAWESGPLRLADRTEPAALRTDARGQRDRAPRVPGRRADPLYRLGGLHCDGARARPRRRRDRREPAQVAYAAGRFAGAPPVKGTAERIIGVSPGAGSRSRLAGLSRAGLPRLIRPPEEQARVLAPPPGHAPIPRRDGSRLSREPLLRALYAKPFLRGLPVDSGTYCGHASSAASRVTPTRENPYARALLLGELPSAAAPLEAARIRLVQADAAVFLEGAPSDRSTASRSPTFSTEPTGRSPRRVRAADPPHCGAESGGGASEFRRTARTRHGTAGEPRRRGPHDALGNGPCLVGSAVRPSGPDAVNDPMPLATAPPRDEVSVVTGMRFLAPPRLAWERLLLLRADPGSAAARAAAPAALPDECRGPQVRRRP